jgi:DNA-binding MarR family transcriptional regulator
MTAPTAVPDLSTIRVAADFEYEFPGASRSASEVAVNLARAQMGLSAEIERPPREAHSLSASAFQTLAILDGAGQALPGHIIAERLLVSSASMTSLVDTLQRRGLVERRPHPTDRRKVLINLTPDGQRVVDQQLPTIHAVIAQAISTLAEPDCEHLLISLTTIRARLSLIAGQPLPPAKARRRRRAESAGRPAR